MAKETPQKDFEAIQSKFIDRLLNQYNILVQDDSYLKPVPTMKQLPAVFAQLYLLRGTETEQLKPAEKFEKIIQSIKGIQTCNNIKEIKLKNVQNSKEISQMISEEFKESFENYLKAYQLEESKVPEGKTRRVQLVAKYQSRESEEIQEQRRLNILCKQMMSLYNIFYQNVQDEIQKVKEKELEKFCKDQIQKLLDEKVTKENKKGETIAAKSPFQKNYLRYQTLLENNQDEKPMIVKQTFQKIYSQNKKEWKLSFKGYQVAIAASELLNEILYSWQEDLRVMAAAKRYEVEQKQIQSQTSKERADADENQKKKINENFLKQKKQAIINNLREIRKGKKEQLQYPLTIEYIVEDKDIKPREKPADKKEKSEKQEKADKPETKKQKRTKQEKQEEVEEAIAEVVEEEPKEQKKDKKRKHSKKE